PTTPPRPVRSWSPTRRSWPSGSSSSSSPAPSSPRAAPSRRGSMPRAGTGTRVSAASADGRASSPEAPLGGGLLEEPGRRREEGGERLFEPRRLVADHAPRVALVPIGVTAPVHDESTAAALPHGPHP